MYSASTSILIETPMRHDDLNRMVQTHGARCGKTDKNYYPMRSCDDFEPIIRRVVDRLGLRTKCVQEGTLIDWEVYKDTPIQVELIPTVHNVVHVPYGVAFTCTMCKATISLVGDGKYGPDDFGDRAGNGRQIRRVIHSARVRITRVLKKQIAAGKR
ncbi:MAG: hypothetical protein IPL86_13355 [Flavobacteriales bacterium]|nr:hypothetical protein [Flavobacteriales bacterium]